MKRFGEMNLLRVGVAGLLVVAVLVTVSLNLGAIRDKLGKRGYTAELAQADGIRGGDPVRVSGLNVGRVTGVSLSGRHVEIKFVLDSGIRVGRKTRAGVGSANALGAKYLELTPAGDGRISTIPLSQTDTSYDVLDAFSDLTRTEQQLDVGQLAKSFDTISETFADTAPDLRGALDGVRALSRSIASRDTQLQALFLRANDVTTILSDRTADVTAIIAHGNEIFAELEARREAIGELLDQARSAAQQLNAVVDENQKDVGPALQKLRRVIGILDRNADNISKIMTRLGPFVRSLGEAVGSGPFYSAYAANLVPSDMAPILPDLIRKDANGSRGAP